jgi:fatty acid desaturase
MTTDTQSYASPRLDRRRARSLWRSLRDQVAGHGLDRPATRTLLWRIPLLSAAGGYLLAQAWFSAGAWTCAAACLGLSFVLAQFAFLGHDAGHGSLGIAPRVNTLVGQCCMSMVTGLAFAQWYGRHRRHHQFCQHESQDPDMDVSLVASLTTGALTAKGPLGRTLTRVQGVSLWFLSLLFAHSQRHLSQWDVVRAPRRFATDAWFLMLHFALWWALPLALGVTPARTLLVYVLPLFFLGPYLAAIFWVNHVGMPLVANPDAFSFLEHQVVTSRTIVNPRSMDWFFGGLNFQIEHHLFPTIPSFRLRRVCELIKPALERETIGYRGVSFAAAIREVAIHFRSVARSARAGPAGT